MSTKHFTIVMGEEFKRFLDHLNAPSQAEARARIFKSLDGGRVHTCTLGKEAMALLNGGFSRSKS
jgi:hypothetical protein